MLDTFYVLMSIAGIIVIFGVVSSLVSGAIDGIEVEEDPLALYTDARGNFDEEAWWEDNKENLLEEDE